MILKIILLFIVVFILITLSHKEISNFSFTSKDDGSIEVNEPIIINKDQNKISFKDVRENSIRVNQICIHDTIKNKTNCLTAEHLGIVKNLPATRKGSFCLGDTCINETHAKALTGQNSLFIKTDPLGKTSLQSETLHMHKSKHGWDMMGYPTYIGNIPYSERTNKNIYDSNFYHQQFRLFSVEREGPADPTAFGASLANSTMIPYRTEIQPVTDTVGNNNSELFN